MFRNNIESCGSHFVRLYGEGGLAKVPQQDPARQHAKVNGELPGMPVVLHEVRQRGRYVHDAGLSACCMSDLPRKLPDDRDNRVED